MVENIEQDEIPQEEELARDENEECAQESSNSMSKSKKGRGSSKGILPKTPMYLEFDEFDLPTGKWEKEYGKHVGQCALKVDINIHEWDKVEEMQKDNMWEETKKKYHIHVDPEGRRRKNFLSAVASRFRKNKSRLVSRFITKTSAPPQGSPNADWHDLLALTYSHASI